MPEVTPLPIMRHHHQRHQRAAQQRQNIGARLSKACVGVDLRRRT